MAKFKVKCNLCGYINKVDNVSHFECSYCHSIQDMDKVYYMNLNNQSYDYYLHNLELAIMNHSMHKMLEAANFIEEIDASDRYCQIYLIAKIENRLPLIKKLDTLNEIDDIIYRYDIILNNDVDVKTKYEVINNIKDEEKKKIYLDMIANPSENDTLFMEDLKNIPINTINYNGFKSFEKIYGLIIIGVSTIIALLLTLFANLWVLKDCLYATIVIIALLPSILYAVGLSKILTIRKKWWLVLLIIPMFIIISYVLTINLHNGSFTERISEHFNHIIYAFNEISTAINDNAEVV